MPRRDGQRTRQRILDTALRLFAERGVDGTGLRAIAEIVGVREPTLYHYFTSKDELVDALIDEAAERLALDVRGRAQGGDLEAALLAAARGFLEGMTRPRGKRLLQVLLVESQHHPARAKTYLERVVDPATRGVAELVAARSRGRSPRGRESARHFAVAFRGALVDFVMHEELIRRGGKDSPDRAAFARQLAAIFAKGS